VISYYVQSKISLLLSPCVIKCYMLTCVDNLSDIRFSVKSILSGNGATAGGFWIDDRLYWTLGYNE
jgi:hypothetical protein